MEKIDYLLKYLSELTTQANTPEIANDYANAEALRARIAKVNDLIEAEIAEQ